MPDPAAAEWSPTLLGVELVARLVAAQHPRWADLDVRPVPVQGNDNRTFRLGDELLVRLPSAAGYASQVAKEQRFLPVLADALPLPVPVPVAAGVPGEGYPFPWSVLRWLPGETVLAAPPTDRRALAADLAAFLAALQSVPTTGAPPAGEHSWYRGAHPSCYDADVQRCLPAIERVPGLDLRRLRRLWDDALATSWHGPPVWFHGDVAAGNLMVRDGRLCAVLDFGCCGIGDPACDLAAAWTVLDPGGRDVLRAGVGADDGTWERGRAWALWKAALMVSDGTAEEAASAVTVLRRVAA